MNLTETRYQLKSVEQSAHALLMAIDDLEATGEATVCPNARDAIAWLEQATRDALVDTYRTVGRA